MQTELENVVEGGREPVPRLPGQVDGRRPRSLGRRLLAMWLPPLGVLVVVLGAWYGVSYLLLSPERRFLVPPPHAVVQVGFLTRDNLIELLEALSLTTRVALLGLAIAVAVGMSWAITMHQARWIERSTYPYAVVLQAIPVLALVPLFGFWFGFGIVSRVLVCVLIALFPIIANTLFGLQSVEPRQHDLFTLHGAGRLRRLWKLELPAALPAIFTGLRISAGLSVIGAIVGDFFFKQGDPGIGILIDLYRARLESERLFAAVICSSLLGVVVFWCFGYLARRVVGRWHESWFAASSQPWFARRAPGAPRRRPLARIRPRSQGPLTNRPPQPPPPSTPRGEGDR